MGELQNAWRRLLFPLGMALVLLLAGRRKWVAFSAFGREWRRYSAPRKRRA